MGFVKSVFAFPSINIITHEIPSCQYIYCQVHLIQQTHQEGTGRVLPALVGCLRSLTVYVLGLTTPQQAQAVPGPVLYLLQCVVYNTTRTMLYSTYCIIQHRIQHAMRPDPTRGVVSRFVVCVVLYNIALQQRLVVCCIVLYLSLEIQYNTTCNAGYATIQQNTSGNKLLDKNTFDVV